MGGIQQKIRSWTQRRNDGSLLKKSSSNGSALSSSKETFFTVLGCMDGRCVQPVADFGREEFGAVFADTITEAGLVHILTHNPSQEFLENLKNKLLISITKHQSKGIVIDGHAECAGDPVPDDMQKAEVKKSVEIIKNLINHAVPVIGIFVHRCPEEARHWEAMSLTA